MSNFIALLFPQWQGSGTIKDVVKEEQNETI